MTHSFHGYLSAIAFSALALGACTAAPVTTVAAATTSLKPAASTPAVPGEAAVRKAINSMVPDAKIDGLRPAPIPGLVEVNVDGDTVYITNDGKFLISGKIIDVANKRDLTEASRAVARRGALKAITDSQMIVFSPSHPKYTVTVFTDVDCGYCRKLHSQIVDYNRAGIAVDYLFFPRDGLDSESYDKAVAVWCASDRRMALTNAKKGLPVAKAHCTNPVATDFNLGVQIGVTGTPAIYTADGTQIGGYLSPTEMRKKLEELAGKPNT